MNLPNALTILRIFFVPLLVAALVQENVSVRVAGLDITNEWLALAIFLLFDLAIIVLLFAMMFRYLPDAKIAWGDVWIGAGAETLPRPSSVVTCLPSSNTIGVTHDSTALPSTITVQEPHWPRPQPNFAAFSSRSPRST